MEQEERSSAAKYINAFLFMASAAIGAGIAFLIAYNAGSSNDFMVKWEFLAAAAFAVIAAIFGLITLFTEMEWGKRKFFCLLSLIALISATIFAIYCYTEKDQIFSRPDTFDSNEELSKLGLLEPVGLKNSKAVFCYFNSLLQCLLSIPEFVTFFFDAKLDKKSRPLTSALREFIISYYKSKGSTSFDVSEVAEEIGKKMGFDTRNQQDVDEYFGAMLEGIGKEDLSKSKNKGLDKLFRIYEETSTTCNDCKTESKRSQSMYAIQAALAPSVQVAINSYYQTVSKHEIDCSKCKAKKDSTHKIEKAVPSQYVFVYLKRGKYDQTKGATKDTSDVVVDETVVLCGKRYDCIGVIFHQGDTSNAGHYYAAAKRDGKWRLFNDEVLSPFNIRDCKKNEATAFLYSHVSKEGNKS